MVLFMMASFFKNELRLLFFGGKGGVGKTTSASATAISLAINNENKKYLLISTDPAHSLSDSFEMKIHDTPTPFFNNLLIREFNAANALTKFKNKYEQEIKLITDRGTYFDNADINSFFNLSLPGIDEVMGILEIAELIEKNEYDTIIVDTAPTGHTLSMLRLPELLSRWLGIFDLMQGKHHILQKHFTRSKTIDSADKFLKMMHDRLKGVSNLFRNHEKTEFIVVMIPEEIVMAETLRLIKELLKLKIPVHNIVVNRVFKIDGCPNCKRRGLNQQPLLSEINENISLNKIFIPIFATEIHGSERLQEFAVWMRKGERERVEVKKEDKTFEVGIVSINNKKLAIGNLDNVRFVMVCGKGGVGKTTTSSATAILLALNNPEIRHRLYSIDPAHSLGDCFSKEIGSAGAKILPNLDIYELNAESLYLAFQAEYEEAIDNLFDQFTGGNNGVDFGYDRELLKELLRTSPPGLDELMALNKVIGEVGKTERIILDTSPTGHFIRFLEIPELVRSWLSAIFELLLKYSGVVRLNTVAEKLVTLSRDIRSVINVITDNKKSCALAVTIPESMAIAETERLVSSIHEHKIRCEGVIVNMATHDSARCDFCASRALSEALWIRKATSLCKNVTLIPYIATDIRGLERLTEFGKLIWKH